METRPPQGIENRKAGGYLKFVYISGPYTKGDQGQNVRTAVYAASLVFSFGHVPFVPHLYHFWDLMFPGEYRQWMELGILWLQKCDAVLRLPGESAGADFEVTAAVSLKIPVFHDIEELQKWLSSSTPAS